MSKSEVSDPLLLSTHWIYVVFISYQRRLAAYSISIHDVPILLRTLPSNISSSFPFSISLANVDLQILLAIRILPVSMSLTYIALPTLSRIASCDLYELAIELRCSL